MITIRDLHKEYVMDKNKGNIFKALKGIQYEIPSGSFFTMLGPSGCGKTTTLRSLAGLDRPTKGEIRFGERIVYSSEKNIFIPPEQRALGMVFQSYAIWPHMTVAQNVAYPLEAKKMAKAEITRKVEEALEKVGLGGYGGKLAPNLSGGQQQRVALARALVSEPELLLLDEPLSNLDAKLREQMRHELKQLQKQLGLTTVYVTHDQEEALALSDTIALMFEGEIVELGLPYELYLHPNKRFTANFIGNSNFVQSRKVADAGSEGKMVVENEFGRFAAKDFSEQSADVFDLSFRPHNIALLSEPPLETLNTGKGRVKDLLFLGENIEFNLVAGDKLVRARMHPDRIPQEGQEVYFSLNPDRSIIYNIELK